MYSTSEAKLKADDAHMKVESNSVATAVRLYKEDNGGKVPYPADASYVSYKGQMVNENDADETKRNIYQASMQILVDEGYLPEVPTSPNGSSYSYMVTEDEKDAVFAAALRVSGSSNNSCEAVSNNSFEASCVLGEYIDILTSCDENNVDYDSETEVCYALAGDRGSNCSRTPYPECEGYPTNDVVEDWVCEGYYPTTMGGFNFCSTPRGPLFADSAVICKLDNSVCSGSSDSDYCSCI